MDRNFEKIAVTPAIRQCITLGASLGVLGGTTDTRKSVGQLKLAYAAKQIFNIARLPTHPERWANTDEIYFNDLATALEQITAEEWNRLIADLKIVYNQLQAALKEDYPIGLIPMKRSIRLIETTDLNSAMSLPKPEELTYGKHLAIVALKAQAEGREQIKFDTDVLTGWNHGRPGCYGEVLIQRDVPIADVFLSQRYLSNSGLEPDEWMVLNREPSGTLQINPNAISLNLTPELREILAEKAENLSWTTLRAYRWNTHRDHLRMPLQAFQYWSMLLCTPPSTQPKEKRRSWRRWLGV